MRKLHRNPSTGKLARNPVTGKLQTFELSCRDCSTEIDIVVTASDLCCLAKNIAAPLDTPSELQQSSVAISTRLTLTTVAPNGACLWLAVIPYSATVRRWPLLCGEGEATDYTVTTALVTYAVRSDGTQTSGIQLSGDVVEASFNVLVSAFNFSVVDCIDPSPTWVTTQQCSGVANPKSAAGTVSISLTAVL